MPFSYTILWLFSSYSSGFREDNNFIYVIIISDDHITLNNTSADHCNQRNKSIQVTKVGSFSSVQFRVVLTTITFRV